ncbi:MAG: hypothetical protein LBG80_03210 [Bacteroidales bacterium]|jgi:hypothetical protein|nr:hypothetical protein [Bacteroidales bacterium]
MKYLKYITIVLLSFCVSMLCVSACSPDEEEVVDYVSVNGIPNDYGEIIGSAEVNKGSRHEYVTGTRNALATYKWEVDNGAIIDKDYNGRTADYQASVFITFPKTAVKCNIKLLIKNVDGKGSELRLAKTVTIK